METNTIKKIIYQEFDIYRDNIIKFQEQYRLLFNEDNRECKNILKNVSYFVDNIINKINEEYEKERRDKQVSAKSRGESKS